jgi:hypothetical protein
MRLPGIDPPPSKHHMFYLAILPPAHVTARITQLSDQLRYALSLEILPLKPNQLHVSPQNLGKFIEHPHDLLTTVCRALRRIKVHRFRANFDRLLTFCRRWKNQLAYPLVRASRAKIKWLFFAARRTNYNSATGENTNPHAPRYFAL